MLRLTLDHSIEFTHLFSELVQLIHG